MEVYRSNYTAVICYITLNNKAEYFYTDNKFQLRIKLFVLFGKNPITFNNDANYIKLPI